MSYSSLSRGASTLVLFLLLVLASAAAQNDIALRKLSYGQRLSAAREAYFKDLEGDHEAIDQAREAFTDLEREHPNDSTVMAYYGSIELLDAARTWAVWNKHKLADNGLAKLDAAVALSPDNLEARFIRAATTWHLPFFYHRREQAESDFAYIAPRAEASVAAGQLPSPLAAAALDYYGQVLADKADHSGARQAYQAAVRIASSSPGGRDAQKRLRNVE